MPTLSEIAQNAELVADKADLSADDLLYLVDGGEGKVIDPVELLDHTGDVTGGVDGVLTIADDAVTEAKIADGAVTSDKVANDAVGNAKLANAQEGEIKLRESSGTGNYNDVKIADISAEITVPAAGDYLLAGSVANPIAKIDVTNLPTAAGTDNTASSVGGSADVFKQKVGIDFEFRGLTPGAGISVTEGTNDITVAVDGVPLAALEDMSADGFVANNTGGSAAPQSLTVAQAQALLGLGPLATDTEVAITDIEDIADLTLLGNDSGGAAAPQALTATEIKTLIGLGGLAEVDHDEDVVVYQAVEFEQDLSASTSDAVAAFPLPFDCDFSTLFEVYVHDAPTGSGATFDVHLGGVTIFSTKITVDDGDNASTAATVPAVFSTSSGTKGQLLEFFVDAVGATTTGTGVDFTLYLTRT